MILFSKKTRIGEDKLRTDCLLKQHSPRFVNSRASLRYKILSQNKICSGLRVSRAKLQGERGHQREKKYIESAVGSLRANGRMRVRRGKGKGKGFGQDHKKLRWSDICSLAAETFLQGSILNNWHHDFRAHILMSFFFLIRNVYFT